MARGRSKSAGKNDQLVRWIESILARKNWSGTELARQSGLAPSTLLRAMNNKDHPFVFSLKTLEKIARVAGEPIPLDLAYHSPQFRPDQGRLREIDIHTFSSLPKALRSPTNATKAETIVIPAHLLEDKTVFAFRNPESDLGDWFPPRSIMFATRTREPIGGDLVVITGRDGRTRVRLLVGVNEAGLSLSKTMPVNEDEKIAFDDISDVAVIVQVIRV